MNDATANSFRFASILLLPQDADALLVSNTELLEDAICVILTAIIYEEKPRGRIDCEKLTETGRIQAVRFVVAGDNQREQGLGSTDGITAEVGGRPFGRPPPIAARHPESVLRER